VKRRTARAVGLLIGAALDATLGDPRQGHPVALFGTAAGRLENRIWADNRLRGLSYLCLCVIPVAGAGAALQRMGRRHRIADTGLVALATWVALGGTSLRREAAAVERRLDDGDLAAARQQLTHLVGRNPSGLDAGEIARAAVESVAENTSDAVVAPLFWGAVAGVPGLLGYRAVNTLDAMVGHHSRRYERFGWASARLDDALNLGPARLTMALTALCAPLIGTPAREVLSIALRDGARHPSPNAGRCEAAFAGALGVTLGGRNTYGSRTEFRPLLGHGPAVSPADLGRANRLNRAVCAAAVVAASGLAMLTRDRLPRGSKEKR
jgi:adenosylcobinamide-phosphate synthase